MVVSCLVLSGLVALSFMLKYISAGEAIIFKRIINTPFLVIVFLKVVMLW